MHAFKTKEEYEGWKVLRLKEAQENRNRQSQAPIERASTSKLPSRIGMAWSDVLPLLLLGVLAAVLAFSLLSLVLKGH